MPLSRSLALAAALAVLAGQAVAGGFSAAVVEPPVVIAEPAAPRGTLGILLPLALLGALVAIATTTDDESDGTTNPPTI